MLKYFHSSHKCLNGLIAYLRNSMLAVTNFDNLVIIDYSNNYANSDISYTLRVYLQCPLTCTQHYCIRMHHHLLDTAVSYPDVRSLLHSYVKLTFALQMFFSMHVYTCIVLDLNDNFTYASYQRYWTSLNGHDASFSEHFVHTNSLFSKLGQLP